MQLCQLSTGVTEHSVKVWLEEQQLLAQLLPPLLEALLLGLGLPAAQQQCSTGCMQSVCVRIASGFRAAGSICTKGLHYKRMS